jgi:hypothetical protein
VISPAAIAAMVAFDAARMSAAPAPCGRSSSIVRLRGRGIRRSTMKRAATASPDSALSMTMRAAAVSSPSASASRSTVARLRVPAFLPAGLPE